MSDTKHPKTASGILIPPIGDGMPMSTNPVDWSELDPFMPPPARAHAFVDPAVRHGFEPFAYTERS